MTENGKTLLIFGSVLALLGAFYIATRGGKAYADPSQAGTGYTLTGSVPPGSPGYTPATFNFDLGSPSGAASLVNPGAPILFDFTPGATVFLPSGGVATVGSPGPATWASPNAGAEGGGCGCGSATPTCPNSTTQAYGSAYDFANALGNDPSGVVAAMVAGLTQPGSLQIIANRTDEEFSRGLETAASVGFG